jgi:DNA topoisomerase-3
MVAGIKKLFGEVSYDPVIRKAKGYFSDNDLKGASHFAIVPNVNTVAKWGAALSQMSSDEKLLFELVARRYLSALGPDREYDSTTLSVLVGDVEFKGSGSVQTKAGWKEAVGGQDTAAGVDEGVLPPFVDGDDVQAVEACVEAKKTTPPSRLSEGALIELMISSWKLIEDKGEADRLKEAKGIGTEATREGIVQNLLNRGFIKTDSGKLFATEIGLNLYRALKEHAPNLLDVAQTARMEVLLDRVEKGEVSAIDTVERIISQASSAIEGFRSAAEVGVKLDVAGARKPSAAMLKAARAKAKREKIALPKGVVSSFTKCSEFLGPMREKNPDGSYPASDGQLKFAQDIAARLGVEVPADAITDSEIMKAWLSKHAQDMPKNNGEVRPPSKKQIAFANRIAAGSNKNIPEKCFINGQMLSDWISENKSKKKGGK